MANDCIPYKEPGERITVKAAAALTGKRFCKISANRTSGPGLSSTAEGSVYVVNVPTAAERVLGVLTADIASGKLGAVIASPGAIVPVLSAAAIAAFEEVEVDNVGRVIPLDAGVAVGFAMTAAADATDAEIKLY